MLYFSSTELREEDVKATVRQPSRVRCSSAHPRPFLGASHLVHVSESELKCLFSVVSAIISLIWLKCFSCSSVQTNFIFFFLVIVVKSGKVEINWVYFKKMMNEAR